jgi:5-methylcytosine-specific restriction endonuclease McrA
MKEQILKLREEGKTYNEIKKILGCSKGTISYHCGEGQKEKTRERVSKKRTNNILSKTDSFKYNKYNKVRRANVFKKTEYDNTKSTKKRTINKNINEDYTWKDVLEKFGENTKCYLSGVELNLYDTVAQFDHIIPVSKGGNNKLNNMGITHKIANMMKSDLTIDELLCWCSKILENNGYEVNKK